MRERGGSPVRGRENNNFFLNDLLNFLLKM